MEKIGCRSPNVENSGVTNIPLWKYDLLRPLILAALADGPKLSKELYPEVRTQIVPEDLDRLGSFNWHITTVRLEMEVRGEIERVPGKSPQVLRLP